MRFSFGDFLLDASRFSLSRNDQPVHIEPRVFEVLLFLLTNRGRIVSKEELIEEVWKQSFVTEWALTRCIKEIRRVLDDGQREQPFVKTVHGRGYRFDGDVHEATAPAGAATVISEAAFIDQDRVVASPSDALPLTPSPPARSSAWRPLLTAATALMLLGLSGRPAVVASSDSPAAVKIALLPISVTEPSSESELLALSMGDLLQQRLAQVPELLLRPPDYGAQQSLEARSLADLATAADIRYVVSGSLSPLLGSHKAQLVVSLHEIRAPDDVRVTPLGRYDVPVLGRATNVREFLSIRDNIARKLLATLLPAVRAGSGNGGPRDASAYRFYLLAIARIGNGTCDGESAIELLRRSLEIDRSFAPAWEAYGWAHYRLASSCGGDATHYDEAMRAAERALKLWPDASGAVALKTAVLLENGKAEEAYASLTTRQRQFETSPDLSSAMSSILTHTGHLDLAQRWAERLERLDPNYPTFRGWIPDPYLHAGRSERFLEALPATRTPMFRYHRGLSLFLLGRVAEARNILEPAFRLNPSDVFARLSQALLSIIDQRQSEAQAILTQLTLERSLIGRRDGAMSYRIGQLHVLSGNRDAALSQLEAAVSQGFFCGSCMEIDPLLAPVRSTPSYARTLDRARLRHREFSRRFELHPSSQPLLTASSPIHPPSVRQQPVAWTESVR